MIGNTIVALNTIIACCKGDTDYVKMLSIFLFFSYVLLLSEMIYETYNNLNKQAYSQNILLNKYHNPQLPVHVHKTGIKPTVSTECR